MTIFRLSLRAILITSSFLLSAAAANAQVRGSGDGWVGVCRDCNSSGPSYYAPPPPPTPEQIEAQRAAAAARQRAAQANALNSQGLASGQADDWDTAANYYQQAMALEPDEDVFRHNFAGAKNMQALAFYNRGDFVTAIAYYQAAINLFPESKDLRDHLAIAQNRLQQAQLEEKQKQEDQAAANSMHDAIQGFAQTLKADSSARQQTGGLAFASAGTSSATSNPSAETTASGLGFGDPAFQELRDAPHEIKAKAPTKIFGKEASSSNPDLTPFDPGRKGSLNSAKQAASASGSSKGALAETASLEDAKGRASCQFEKNACGPVSGPAPAPFAKSNASPESYAPEQQQILKSDKLYMADEQKVVQAAKDHITATAKREGIEKQLAKADDKNTNPALRVDLTKAKDAEAAAKNAEQAAKINADERAKIVLGAPIYRDRKGLDNRPPPPPDTVSSLQSDNIQSKAKPASQ